MNPLLATLAFPSSAGAHVRVPPARMDVTLRPAKLGDIAFLRALYGKLRDPELAGVDWPEAARQAFLDQQFAFQHRHYLQQFPAADYTLIEHAGQAIGRLYLNRRERDWHLIDIGLEPSAQGLGIGTGLLRHIQYLTQAADARLGLHVQTGNRRAHALYIRLGFVADNRAAPDNSAYLAMHWPPCATVS